MITHNAICIKKYGIVCGVSLYNDVGIFKNSPNASRACEKDLLRTLPSAAAAPATALLVQAPQGREKLSLGPFL